MFYIIDTQSISNVRQCSVGGIEEHVCTCVILRSYPFPFQDSPKRFCNVQMWGIWWKEKQEKSSVFPYRSEFLNPLVPMHCCIVKHDKGVLSDTEGEIVKETDNLVCRHPLGSGESLVLVVTCDHTENVESCDPLGRNEHVLSIQLPTVWHISFSAGMALIGIVERNTPVTCLSFKFLQRSHRHSRAQYARHLPELQVLATSRPCIRRVAARGLPLGVFLYAYILRQC